ncbi:Peptidase_M28 domain-containing protein [Nitrospina watsonii]|uniref:Peptidase_M28 domain-containing protein n=1 Tax=Nitrospina watsonii TaxID=1323948 RepID=A0ABM9HF88_9BACT|nr:Peptidase_M28 domain-containing protein [Nitrospina watsonii]
MRGWGWGVLLLMTAFMPGQLAGEPDPTQGYRALLWKHLEALCAMGPRYPGSAGHAQTRAYIRDIAERYADSWKEQAFVARVGYAGELPLYNYELTFKGTGRTGHTGGSDDSPPILLGAHYDTRPFADEETDPEKQEQPIVGANDGGSGTAILLGMAQYLHENPPERPVKLVFFDGEDYGRRGSDEYFLGSSYYAEQLKQEDPSTWPARVLVVDMVGKKDVKIFKEVYSFRNAPGFLDTIYKVAEDLGNTQFVPMLRYSVRDDHLPFIYLKIPSVLLIDFDYPYWHTLEDTLDKCSPDSLLGVFEVVVETLKRV